jgi:hypothetical protein
MATYNDAVATGWQGLWTYEAGNPTYTPIQNRVVRRNGIKRLMNRSAYRGISELFDTLLGAAVGGAASKTHTQVQAVTPEFGPGVGGGARTIETVTDISRNTTATDLARLKEMTFAVSSRPASYVKDLSGNGGPAY